MFDMKAKTIIKTLSSVPERPVLRTLSSDEEPIFTPRSLTEEPEEKKLCIH